jgi:hypothetical protein
VQLHAAVLGAARGVVDTADVVRRDRAGLAEARRGEVAGDVGVAALEHVDDRRRTAVRQALVELLGALGVRVALDDERLREVGLCGPVAELGRERVLAARAQVV